MRLGRQLSRTKCTRLSSTHPCHAQVRVGMLPIVQAIVVDPTNARALGAIEGTAGVRLGRGETEVASPGDAVVVPPDTRFEIAPLGDDTLRMLCWLPVGGQARTDDGSVFTPPWAQ